MKALLRTIFSPILNIFEGGEGDYEYKPSHRIILIVFGCLFSGLASAVLWMSEGAQAAHYLPVVIFGGVGFVALVVGLLGTDRAVSTIWRSSRR